LQAYGQAKAISYPWPLHDMNAVIENVTVNCKINTFTATFPHFDNNSFMMKKTFILQAPHRATSSKCEIT